MHTKIPDQVQSFGKIMTQNMLYADKTKLIYQMITGPSRIYLARPKGFGKTLLTDTIAEIMKGRQKHFHSLWLGSSGYEFTPHPVLSLSLSLPDMATPAKLTESIRQSVKDAAADAEIDLPDQPLDVILVQLLKELCEKTGQKAAVLIDDCDAPVLDFLSSKKVAIANTVVLSEFFRIFDEAEEFIRLFFMTGSTTLARMSLEHDSKFTDISMDPKYSSLCGLTDAELDDLFRELYEPILKKLIQSQAMPAGSKAEDLRLEIFRRYGGYTFDGQTLFWENTQNIFDTVLNTRAVLNVFQSEQLVPYWVRFSQPDFLPKFITKNPKFFFFTTFSGYNREVLDYLNPRKKPDPHSLLYQTGNLTLNYVKEGVGEKLYSLRVPNEDVAEAFRNSFAEAFFQKTCISPLPQEREQFIKAVTERSCSFLEARLWDIHVHFAYRPTVPADEKFLKSIIRLYLYCLGLTVRPFVTPTVSYMDLDFILPDNTYYLVESKYDPACKTFNASLGRPLKVVTVKDDQAPALAKITADQAYDRYKTYRPRGEFKEIIGLAIGICDRRRVKVRFEKLDILE